MALYLLFESASGYGLFERTESEEIGIKLSEVQKSISDLSRFSKIVKMVAFLPFKSAEDALDNINHISLGELTDTLRNFLESNLPKAKPGKLTKYTVGVTEPELGRVIQETLGIRCQSDDVILELLRGVRLHFDRFVKVLKPGDLQQAQLGLGHSYSRAKVKFNVNKVDNMIIQSIALLDQLDKDLNTFAMRVREWYSWHFPELIRVVNDNYQFCKLACLIKNKSSLTEADLPAIEEITKDEAKAREVLEAARMSMGTDISDIDMINIERFAQRVVQLANYRKQLHAYLQKKMNDCAPNLSALIGEQVGARLISHAGSLTNLAKYPASTVQILGAEKALFRALKTKGNTPKYGLIFHSTFIGRATPQNKGRISRYVANKCSIASRIDAFSDVPSTKFGEELRTQVEERLEFYKSGKTPRKNVDVMHNVVEEMGVDVSDVHDLDDEKLASLQTSASTANGDSEEQRKKKKKDKKKRKAEDGDAAMEDGDQPAPKKQKVAEEEEPAEAVDDKEKKKKKKKKKEKDSDE